MPRIHFVKKARKDNPVAKKGESYFWWKNRVTCGKSYRGIKRYSKTRPRPSQLTTSEFLSSVYSVQERAQDADNELVDPSEQMEAFESLASELSGELESIASEQEEKRDNMPDGLQQGPTGALLEERAQYCRDMAERYTSIDFSLDDNDALETQEERVEEALGELGDVEYEGE